MLGWMEPADFHTFDFVEFFAGKQALTKEMSHPKVFHVDPSIHDFAPRHMAGYRCASYDRDFHGRAVEFNSSSGSLRPGCLYHAASLSLPIGLLCGSCCVCLGTALVTWPLTAQAGEYHHEQLHCGRSSTAPGT